MEFKITRRRKRCRSSTFRRRRLNRICRCDFEVSLSCSRLARYRTRQWWFAPGECKAFSFFNSPFDAFCIALVKGECASFVFTPAVVVGMQACLMCDQDHSRSERTVTTGVTRRVHLRKKRASVCGLLHKYRQATVELAAHGLSSSVTKLELLNQDRWTGAPGGR